MEPTHLTPISRRQLFQRTGYGIGGLALASLLQEDSFGAEKRQDPLAPRPTHFPAKAKNVIYIHLVGGPSHLDLYDFKPELQKRNGELCPAELFEGKRFAFIRSRPKLLGTPDLKDYRFEQSGDSGATISNLMPHLQTVADELCFIKSLHTEEFNHAPAQLFMQTGFGRFGRPSLGSWVSYGLGSENRNLPSFVVLITGQMLGAGSAAWGSGFLPTIYQGIEFRSQGDPVLYLSNPKGIDGHSRRRVVDAVNQLNQATLADVGDPEIATRINQYEMAYRMQSSVPELMDIQSEPEEIHQMYGTEPGKATFANNCLLARRMVERGVRFVQLFDQGWDTHNNVFNRLPTKTKQVDQPLAALIKDLKQRGLLDETLVVWSSEFGRTSMAQGRTNLDKPTNSPGRDHQKDAFTVWLAGGGVKGGMTVGASDELGYKVAERPVHVHDLNATLLHLLGINHERLTFRHQGRQYRLTDVEGHVVREIIS
ncbi:Sulfatase [Planctomycetales bacterium 10988]|nr:Sulfatase [Planctomycetales bacterium 10988]